MSYGDKSGKPPEVDHLSKILCPFCSAPWTAENIQTFDLDASDHCDSGRFYIEQCTISIVCHACNREMYRKEGHELR